ncbi:hypothetical protein I316_07755 [Kwoniella heveanensis BCC8398]|uniref:Uncharacterized protein n=1 Tax=Kwoniella heveanensis BCC8398 TaxID=1296120 RepID=A0A1B9GI29_9TREE|nr:hypothetical protein I316_07755 [Kwoniella heveanensis BCC8398]
MSSTSSTAPPSLASLASRAQSLLPEWAAATGMSAARSVRFISKINSIARSNRSLITTATDADKLAFRSELAKAYPTDLLGEKPVGLQGVPSDYDKSQLSQDASKCFEDLAEAMSEFQEDFDNIDMDDPKQRKLMFETASILTDALSLMCSPQSGLDGMSAQSAQERSSASDRSSGFGAGAGSSIAYSGRSNSRFDSSNASRRTPTSLPLSGASWSHSSGSAYEGSYGSSGGSSGVSNDTLVSARAISVY